MNKSIKNIVIIGGGSAGWLTAGIIAAEHKTNSVDGINVTLVESPDIASIGVGEGTWPTMRNTLQTIGISENEFIQCCDASFKQGSQFIGWVDGSPQDSYYHPFMAPQGFGQSNICGFWQSKNHQVPFAHAVSFQPHLCDHGCAPKQKQTPEFAAVANYGYHLNAAKFSSLLQKHCCQKLGVRYVLDNVSKINGNKDDNIESITTQTHGDLVGELYIDCSGSNALLIGQHYQIPFKSKKHILFNDSALAVQVPYTKDSTNIRSHTVSTAQESGWIWDIGLPTRRGIGYTYASNYTNDDKARNVLLNYLQEELSYEVLNSLDIRKLSFSPGHREKFWHKNCVAVGMASGFLEPLEASALALVELSAKMIAKELPAHQNIMQIAEERFNKRFLYRWQRIIEFLKLHYVLSKRNDSAFWQDNRAEESIPDRLKQLLILWKYQEPSYNDFTEIEEIFPAASYQYILYGMGFKTQERATARRYDNDKISEMNLIKNHQLCQKYLSGLPNNRELIDFIVKNNSTS